FCPIASPTNNLELQPQPITVFKKFKIKLLTSMRPAPDQKRGEVLSMRTFNYRRDHADLVMTLFVVDTTADAPFEQVGQELIDKMGLSPAAPVEWITLDSSPLRVITKPFTAKGGNGRDLTMRMALVRLTSTRYAMVNFGLTAQDDFDRLLYEDKSEQ